MATQYFCRNRDRWKKVQDSDSINGIDYLEVDSGQLILRLYFLHNLPGETSGIPAAPALTAANVLIEGGVRIKGISVLAATSNDNVLEIAVDKPGDFSIYTLKITDSSVNTDQPPEGFDEQLSAIDFSFKVNCPNEFDCKPQTDCPPDEAAQPPVNYLAKDYASFNRLMFDRLSSILPKWKERNAADLQIALLELLAYTGDYLSYYQDAVGTEAYLGTARRRVSLKRHARLLDYYVHDGCNARTWVQLEIDQSSTLILDRGKRLLTNGKDGQPSIRHAALQEFINEREPAIFETMHEVSLHGSHNRISFYTWGDHDCCLPAGSTKATLKNEPALFLKADDVLLFEEIVDPHNGSSASADPSHRHAVRLKKVEESTDKLTSINILRIEWYEEDALPFPLCLTSPVANADVFEGLGETEKSIARGNMVLADHGMTRSDQQLDQRMVKAGEKYYPRLPEQDIVCAVRYDHSREQKKAAAAAIAQDPHEAVAVVKLTEGEAQWTATRELLGSDRFATSFVVEREQDGTSFLRFGNDVFGKRPVSGTSFVLAYRAGGGRSGNIGADTINTVEWEGGGIHKVRNPLAAKGGLDPETMEEIRQFAPQAFRTQQRAVTEADYVSKAILHPEVQNAAARFYWTGSWYTVYLIIDRRNGKEIDESFKNEIRRHMEKYRMAGYDLEVKQPQFVPLSIVLNVCVKPGYFRANVKQELLRVFSNGRFANGSSGFFHPDNFTFGQDVYLSAIYRDAMKVQGVASVEIKEFKRWSKRTANEINNGRISPSTLEIIRLDNDPSLPENGKIDFIMFGGL